MPLHSIELPTPTPRCDMYFLILLVHHRQLCVFVTGHHRRLLCFVVERGDKGKKGGCKWTGEKKNFTGFLKIPNNEENHKFSSPIKRSTRLLVYQLKQNTSKIYVMKFWFTTYCISTGTCINKHLLLLYAPLMAKHAYQHFTRGHRPDRVHFDLSASEQWTWYRGLAVVTTKENKEVQK